MLGGELMDKVKTSVSIDKDIYEKIKQIGKKEDRKFSNQLNQILKEYFQLGVITKMCA